MDIAVRMVVDVKSPGLGAPAIAKFFDHLMVLGHRIPAQEISKVQAAQA